MARASTNTPRCQSPNDYVWCVALSEGGEGKNRPEATNRPRSVSGFLFFFLSHISALSTAQQRSQVYQVHLRYSSNTKTAHCVQNSTRVSGSIIARRAVIRRRGKSAILSWVIGGLSMIGADWLVTGPAPDSSTMQTNLILKISHFKGIKKTHQTPLIVLHLSIFCRVRSLTNCCSSD